MPVFLKAHVMVITSDGKDWCSWMCSLCHRANNASEYAWQNYRISTNFWFSTFASDLVMRLKGVDKNLYFFMQSAAFKTFSSFKVHQGALLSISAEELNSEDDGFQGETQFSQRGKGTRAGQVFQQGVANRGLCCSEISWNYITLPQDWKKIYCPVLRIMMPRTHNTLSFPLFLFKSNRCFFCAATILKGSWASYRDCSLFFPSKMRTVQVLFPEKSSVQKFGGMWNIIFLLTADAFFSCWGLFRFFTALPHKNTCCLHFHSYIYLWIR